MARPRSSAAGACYNGPMHISGLQKLTLLDYPGKTACTVFTPGCNLRCPFCQNRLLVVGEEQPDGTRAFPLLPPDALDNLLAKRHGLLDGVCITGGEPLLQPDLAQVCARIHEQGFLVKLDTNGTLPDRLAALLDAGLVDYVALDVKNAPARYAQTVGAPEFDAAVIERSIALLQDSGLPHEFRTTVVHEFHTADDLRSLATLLADAPAWYLQPFKDSGGVIAGPGTLHGWPIGQLKALLPELQRICPTVHLRES